MARDGEGLKGVLTFSRWSRLLAAIDACVVALSICDNAPYGTRTQAEPSIRMRSLAVLQHMRPSQYKRTRGWRPRQRSHTCKTNNKTHATQSNLNSALTTKWLRQRHASGRHHTPPIVESTKEYLFERARFCATHGASRKNTRVKKGTFSQ